MAGFVQEADGNFVMSHSDIVKVRGKGVLTDVLEDMEESIPTKTSDLNNDDGFIKSYVYPLVSHTETTATIDCDKFHVWGSAVSSLNVTLAAPAAGTGAVMHEWLMQFTIANNVGSPTIAITMFAGGPPLVWASQMEFSAGKTYQISIVNGYAIGVEF